MFIVLWPDVSSEITLMNDSEPLCGVPITWILILVNCVTQYVSIHGACGVVVPLQWRMICLAKRFSGT